MAESSFQAKAKVLLKAHFVNNYDYRQACFQNFINND